MDTVDLFLTKNLRKSILRGHPWVYRNALSPASESKKSCLGRLLDARSQLLCWGIYDPHSPIGFRVVSTNTQKPDVQFFKKRLVDALALRSNYPNENTSCFRLINGEGDQLPGLVCDIYGKIAVVQFDGEGPKNFWEKTNIVELISEIPFVEIIVEKSRGGKGLLPIYGSLEKGIVIAKENSLEFYVDIAEGQKTGFFLDQRDNRKYLSEVVKGKSFLNCFSYTGGFSVSAGSKGSSQVSSFDISQKALDLAQKNWELNDLPKENHNTIKGDIFNDLKNLNERWDAIVVDPPSMAKSEKQKENAIQKYIHLFSDALQKLEVGGDLFLSSCSSHINFEDFYEICSQSFSKVRRRGTMIRISGQGLDHPFPLACQELRYLKFMHIKAD